MPIDYSKAKIYKLISYETNKVYFGSTCEPYLSSRLAGHKATYKVYKKGASHYVSSYDIIKYDDCDIVLVENYPCKDKNELYARERYYIELDRRACVNNRVPIRAKGEYIKEWKTKNKDILRVKDAIWYQKNKDIIKQKMGEKITCVCGSMYRRDDQSKHLKRPIHLIKLNKKIDIEYNNIEKKKKDIENIIINQNENLNIILALN